MNDTVMILRKCHINSRYKGYSYIPEAVKIMDQFLKGSNQTIRMGKDVYPVIAEMYKTTPGNIEAAIRSTIDRCWRNNRTYVQEILGYQSVKCPSNIEFLDAIVFYTSTELEE